MMNYIKAFIAGITVPSVLLPFFLCLAKTFGKPQLLNISFFHFLPIIWGIWNILYFSFLKQILPANMNFRLLLTGALLGLLVAIYGVFWLNLPNLLGMPSSMRYLPIIVAPVVYAILWRFLVNPLNELLNIYE